MSICVYMFKTYDISVGNEVSWACLRNSAPLAASSRFVKALCSVSSCDNSAESSSSASWSRDFLAGVAAGSFSRSEVAVSFGEDWGLSGEEEEEDEDGESLGVLRDQKGIVANWEDVGVVACTTLFRTVHEVKRKVWTSHPCVAYTCFVYRNARTP